MEAWMVFSFRMTTTPCLTTIKPLFNNCSDYRVERETRFVIEFELSACG